MAATSRQQAKETARNGHGAKLSLIRLISDGGSAALAFSCICDKNN
jgi:hypothetical protein